MRFGISATSSIFPKNFRTRFRPINVCAIMSSRSIEPRRSNRRVRTIATPNRRGPWYRGDQDDSPEGRNPSRPSGQASDALFLRRFGKVPNRPNRFAARRRSRWYSALSAQTTGISVFQPNDPTNSRSFGSLISQEFPGTAGNPLCKHCLLKLNLGACLFELRLDLGRVVLVDAFLDRLGSAFDQVLGLLQAQPGDSANLLNHLDFLLADGGKNDRKLGLFLGSGSRASHGSSGNCDCCGSRDAPLVLK